MHLNGRKCSKIALLAEVGQKWDTESSTYSCGKTVTVYLLWGLLAREKTM